MTSGRSDETRSEDGAFMWTLPNVEDVGKATITLVDEEGRTLALQTIEGYFARGCTVNFPEGGIPVTWHDKVVGHIVPRAPATIVDQVATLVCDYVPVRTPTRVRRPKSSPKNPGAVK